MRAVEDLERGVCPVCNCVSIVDDSPRWDGGPPLGETHPACVAKRDVGASPPDPGSGSAKGPPPSNGRPRVRGPRAPSAHYALLAVDAGGLTDGQRRVAVADAAELADGVRQMAGSASEAIVYLHESAGLHPLAEARPVGTHGWEILDGHPRVHLCPPGAGYFQGLGGALEVLEAARTYRDHLGMAMAFSGASTLTKIVKVTHPDLGASIEEPFLEGWARAGCASGYSWRSALRPATGYVACFDRNAHYLAAWGSLACSAGAWELEEPFVATEAPESSRPAGYWLIDRPRAGTLLPDPFARAGDPGRIWVTTPLLQLAVDHLGRVPVHQAYVATRTVRALDDVVGRLRRAREILGDEPVPASTWAALKASYVEASQWFETLPPPDPLARPYWARAVHDRATANAWRSLAAASAPVLAFGRVDTAAVLVPSAEAVPAGLRIGSGLGAWKPVGAALPVDQALEALDEGQLPRLLEVAGG